MRSVALFLAWAAVGFVGSFALLYGSTPAGPLLVLVLWLAYRYLPRIDGRRRPEGFGALAGFGCFWLLIASTVDGQGLPFVAAGLLSIVSATLCYVVEGHERCTGDAALG